jgi:hypothetical protein
LTEYGYRYAGIRALPEGDSYVRTYHYVLPFTQLRPAQLEPDGSLRPFGPGHFWVPIDDNTCMVWNFQYTYGDEALTDAEQHDDFYGNGPAHVDQTTFRSIRHSGNDYLIDRQVQKTETYTGIVGVNTQDRAVQESMGPIVDRSREYLGPTDKAIIAMRRLLLDATRTVQRGGSPPAADTSYYHLRAIDRIVPAGTPWREALLPLMYPEGEKIAVPVVAR